MALTSPTTSRSMMSTKSDSVPLDLRHPTPDLQSLSGGYLGNIERLEEHAERMSSRGSDIAEEIRKLQLEQKIADSRRSSMRSAPPDEARMHPDVRSRNASASSYTNSIVDVNGQARWGGYSPGGFVTSPVGSIRSCSWSQPSVQRQRSVSRASRLGQVIQPEDDEDRLIAHEGPTSSPVSHTTVPHLASPKAASRRSVSSFTRQYDQIAQEIQDEFQQVPHGVRSVGVLEHVENDGGYFPSYHDLPDRPATAASGDTYHQARTLFHDFDGVHCSPIEEDVSISQDSRNSSLLRSVPALPQQGQPPPAENMVFYPAPVPKMLNLPKRLSQLPAASVQAKRRTQLLDSMSTDVRKSAVWLPEELRNSTDSLGPTSQNRKSIDPRKSLAGLPPQLRASVFFDQVAQTQEVEVKGDSAEATLDSILEASAHAPASAFTDHPFAGHIGDEVYGKEQARKSTTSLLKGDKPDARKSRSSLNLLNLRRNSSGDKLNKLQKRSSIQDLDKLTTRNSSRMSLGPELEGTQNRIHGAEEHETKDAEEVPRVQSSSGSDHQSDVEDVPEEEGFHPEELPAPPSYGPPTTLLAELQMRKQQQKSRNRTAATAFPNGMHSTLLELDAVAEVEKKRRHGQRVALAWEDPELKATQEADDDDDDVPLGMLFPGRDGLVNKKKGDRGQISDWDRPLGLIAQRELEDNEPLSRRRTRLLGVDPRTRDLSPSKRLTSINVTPSPEPSPSLPLFNSHNAMPPVDDGEEEETLAQRKQRLKSRETLNAAIGDVQARPVSGEFASEMLSQFGPSREEDKSRITITASDEDEETLGQRRARLQAEALVRSNTEGTYLNPSAANRPALRSSHSMADILAAHPVNDAARKVSDEMLISSLPRGSLLQQDEARKTRHKADIMQQNKRSTSYGLERPLLGEIGKTSSDPAISARINAFKGGIYNNGMGGAGAISTPSLTPSNMMTPNTASGMMSSMNFPHQPYGHFGAVNSGMPASLSMNFLPNSFGYPKGYMTPQQTMGMSMGMGVPMTGLQAFFPQMNGMPQHGMSMPIAMPMQPPIDPVMDPKQRDMIDRWRQSIMH